MSVWFWHVAHDKVSVLALQGRKRLGTPIYKKIKKLFMKAYQGFPEPSVTSSNCPFFIQATVKNPKTLHWLSWLTNKGSKSSQLRSWNQQVLDIFARKRIEMIGWLSKKPSKFQSWPQLCVVDGVFGILWKGLIISIDFVLFIDHALTPTFFSSSLLIDWSLLLFPLLHLHSCFLLCCLILLRAVLLGVQPCSWLTSVQPFLYSFGVGRPVPKTGYKFRVLGSKMNHYRLILFSVLCHSGRQTTQRLFFPLLSTTLTTSATTETLSPPAVAQWCYRSKQYFAGDRTRLTESTQTKKIK